MRISFDFDDTLEDKEVQKVAKELIELGHDVCILTTRYEDPSKYEFKITHDKLFAIAKELGITEIHFTNFEWKYLVVDEFNIDLHIDDNYRQEVCAINENCRANAISYGGWGDSKWKSNIFQTVNKFTANLNKGD